MKILKAILWIVLALFLIYLLLCFMGPKKLDVTRSMEMNASPQTVYQQISNLKTWEKWGPWHAQDPEMKVVYGGKVSGVGASYSWESKKLGNGSLEVTEANPGKSMKTKLSFGPRGGANGSWNFEPVDGGKTKVSWGMIGEPISFFYRGMMKLMGMEKGISKMFDTGLGNIKEIVEKITPLPAGVSELTVGGMKYLAARKTIPWSGIKDFFANNFGSIMGYMGSQKIEPAGAPRGLFYVWNEENKTTDMAAAIPLTPAKPLGEGTSINSKAGPISLHGNTLVFDHYGGYTQTGPAHIAMGRMD